MKKNIVLLLLVLVIITMVGCSQVEQQKVMSAVTNALELPEIKAIREMTTDDGIMLGDLFEAGLSSPTYELYDPAEDGNTYVTIKGNVNYNGQDIVVAIQYKQVKDDYYEFYTITYNDIPQNMLQANAFYEYLYEQYENSKQEIDTNTSIKTSSGAESASQVSNLNNILDLFKMNQDQIIKSFGDPIDSTSYEGAFWLIYDAQSFAFDYNDNSMLAITLYHGMKIEGITIGDTPETIRNILGNPIEEYFYEDEMSEGDEGYYMFYEKDGYQIQFYSTSEFSPTVSVLINEL